MEMENGSRSIGIGGTENESAVLAALLVALQEMGQDWENETGFKLNYAIKALGTIVEALAPLIEVSLAKGNGHEVVKDSPAMEQLRELHSALSDLSSGRGHPQLEPTNYGGTSSLRYDEKQFQTALVELVEIIQELNEFENRKDAEMYVVQKLRIKYKGKPVSQRQLADMARAVKKRPKN